MRPAYVYVASSWRNPIQPAVCQALAAAGIDHYDFRNPPGGTGFSWKQVKTDGAPASQPVCHHCNEPIFYHSMDVVGWRHVEPRGHSHRAAPKKGSDWETVDTYLQMVTHPVATAGFDADFGAMQRADTFVMVLPCGKSAHLELGWAAGAGKRTAILLEDPVEPELMYRMVDFMARDVEQLLAWMGVHVA